MAPTISWRMTGHRSFMAAAALALMMAACGKTPAPADNVGPKMKGGAAKAAPTPADTVLAKSNLFLSVFSTNEARDPFNPKAKPKQAPTAASVAEVKKVEQDSLVKALQNVFAGVYGGRGAYFAVLNDEILEVKHDTILSLVVNGEPKKLRVRPVKILPGICELQVEGSPQTITVRRGRQ